VQTLSAKAVTLMKNNTDSTVIYLDSHPSWRAASRRSRELAEAMRRHPSYQGRLEADCHPRGRALLSLCPNDD